MIKVIFFAKLREDLQTAEIAVDAEGLMTVSDLVNKLIADAGELFAEKLNDAQIITAVNHQKVERTALIADGDEVAFFPPVTGG